MKGNEALAESAIRAGMKAYFGYPITPQSEILEYLSRHGAKNNVVVLQSWKWNCINQYGFWCGGCWREGNDGLFKPRNKFNARRNFLFSRGKSSLRNCKCTARWSPDSEQFNHRKQIIFKQLKVADWRLSFNCACAKLCTRNGWFVFWCFSAFRKI